MECHQRQICVAHQVLSDTIDAVVNMRRSPWHSIIIVVLEDKVTDVFLFVSVSADQLSRYYPYAYQTM
jgi:hypothetical protein